MVISDVLSAVEGVKQLKNQADYLTSLTEKIENASEILQAKAIELDLVKRVEEMQNTMDVLKQQNEQLTQQLRTKTSVKPVQIEGEYGAIMLYEADFGGVQSLICPNCYQAEEKTISLKTERVLMGSVGIGSYSSSTTHDRYTCPRCKEIYLKKVVSG